MAKKSFKKLFLPLFIIFILVGSTLGVIFGGSSPQQEGQSFDYNGHEILLTSQGYSFSSRGFDFLLFHNPLDLEAIPSDFVSLEAFTSAQKIYVSVDPSTLSQDQFLGLQRNIFPLFSVPLLPACPQDSEACKDFPLKTCQDASPLTPVLFLVNASQPQIIYRDSCLTLQGDEQSFVQVTERLALIFAFGN